MISIILLVGAALACNSDLYSISKTVYVDQQADPSGSGTECSPFNSLSVALAVVNELGGTVLLLSSADLSAATLSSELLIVGFQHQLSLSGILNITGKLTMEGCEITPGLTESGFRVNGLLVLQDCLISEFERPIVEVVGGVHLISGTYTNNRGTVVIATDATVLIEGSKFEGNSGPVASVLQYECSGKKPGSSMPEIRLASITVSQQGEGAAVSVACVWDTPSTDFGLVQVSGSFLTSSNASTVIVDATSLEVIFANVTAAGSSFALQVMHSYAPVTVANATFADISAAAILIDGFSSLVTISSISCTACVQAVSITAPIAVCHLSYFLISKGGGSNATLNANCAEMNTWKLHIDQIVGPTIDFSVSALGVYNETVVEHCEADVSLVSYVGLTKCEGIELSNNFADEDLIHFDGSEMFYLRKFLIDNCTAGASLVGVWGVASSHISSGRISNSYSGQGIFTEGLSTILHTYDDVEVVDVSTDNTIWYVDGNALTRISNVRVHLSNESVVIMGPGNNDFNVTDVEVTGVFQYFQYYSPILPTFLNHLNFHDIVCSNLFVLDTNTVYLRNSVFRNITLLDNVVQKESIIVFANVTFTELRGTLISIRYTHFTLIDAVFLNCSIFKDKSLISAFQSTVHIQHSEFTTFTGVSSGALFKLQKSSTVTLRFVSLRNLRMQSTNGFINVFQSNFTIENSSVNDFNSSIFEGLLRNIATRNCNITDGYSDRNFNGGYIRSENCLSVVIESSAFARIVASSGGVIFVVFTYTISFAPQNDYGRHVVSMNSSYEDCRSKKDGGVMHLSDASAWIQNTTFRRNSESNGGALQLLCDYFSTSYFCNYTLIDVLFQDNSAALSGGGYSYRLIKPFAANVTDINNTAKYGMLMAGYPVSLSRVGTNSSTISAESGVTLHSNLTLGLFDLHGQLVETDNKSAARVVSFNSSSTLSGITRIFPTSGLYNFDSFAILDHPGSTVKLLFQSEGLDYKHADPNSNSTPTVVALTASLRLCVVGEILVGLQCVSCPSGSYSFDTSDVSCNKCVLGMHCFGGANVGIHADYWRPNNLSDSLFKCPINNICLNAADSECEIGYEGRLCTVCSPGHFRTGKFRCFTCGNETETIAKAVSVILAFVAFLIYITYSALASAERVKSPGGPLTRILLNYIQTVGLITNFELEWPYQILKFTEGISVTGSGPMAAFSSSCFEFDFGAKEVYIKLLISSVLPVLLSLLAFAVWGSVATVKRNVRYVRDHFLCTVTVILLAMHPNVLSAALELIACKSMEDGTSWMIIDFREQCWRGENARYSLTLALPAFLVWVVAAPFVILVSFVKSRKFKEKKSVKLRYSFLSAVYKESLFYWEFVILTRKTSFLVLQSILASSPIGVQVFATLILLLFFYELHLKSSPFLLSLLNIAEAIAILSIILNIATGLLLTYGKSQNVAWDTFVVVLYISSTAIFFGFWVVSLVITFKIYSSKNCRIYGGFSLGSAHCKPGLLLRATCSRLLRWRSLESR